MEALPLDTLPKPWLFYTPTRWWAKLDAAAKRRAAGDCAGAANIYQAFINELTAQSGKGVDATAAATMIGDAQYLIAHCP